MTQQLPVFDSITDVSGTFTSTGNSGSLDGEGMSLVSFTVNITAASGSSPTLSINIQESDDQSNWISIATTNTFTGVSTQNMRGLPLSSRYYRYVYTITGSTPSFTFSINTTLKDQYRPPVGQAVSALSGPVVIASDQSAVPASQSGTWNINNVSGTVSLPTGASTSALQTTGNTSLASIDSKLNTLGQKTMSASVPVAIASDQTAVPASQSGTWNINNVSGTVSLPTGAATSALQTTGNTSLSTIATAVTLAQGSTTSGQTGNLTLGAVTTSAPTYTTGQTDPISLTTAGAVRTDSSGTTQPVSGTVTANQGGSWTVTANAGTNLNTSALALDTSVNGILVSQGSTTSGEKGPLIQGAVTTAAPSYSTAQTSPLSLTTAGALRTDASATTQPVSGTVTAKIQDSSGSSITLGQHAMSSSLPVAIASDQTGIAVKLSDATGNNVTLGQKAMASSLPVVIASDQSSVSVAVPDKTQSSSVSGLNGTTSFLCNGCETLIMQIGGSWSGTLTFQYSQDGSNWNQAWAYTIPSSFATAPQYTGVVSTNASGNFLIPVAGYAQVRVLMSAFTSGTATVLWEGSVSGQQIPVVQTTAANLQMTASQGGSWTVNANAGTNLNTSALALDTSVNGILVSQGSTTSGEKGPLIQGAVTTGSPSYTTAQTSPLSLTTAGAVRVDASATVQPVSQSGTWNINNISGTISLPTGASTSALQTTGNTSLSTIATALTLAQGSTTSGQTGALTLAAVTTAAPSYSTGQTDPLSMNTSGGLRVDGSGVAQPIAINRTALTTAASGGTITTANADPFNNLIVVSESSAYARWGTYFYATTSGTASGAASEVSYFYLKNVNTNTKSVRIKKITLSAPQSGGTSYKFYIDPTVTANGTSITIVGGRRTSQNSVQATAFTLPTTSARGTIFKYVDLAVSDTFTIDFDYALWIEPNHSLLISSTQSLLGGLSGVECEWVEE